MLNVHRGNRVESLAATLAETVRSPLANPFTREIIAVQGPGMARWLAMQLAERLGIWANPDFPYPRNLIDSLLDIAPSNQKASTGSTETLFAADVLQWIVAELLPPLLTNSAFEPVRHFLDKEGGADRLLPLSRRLGRLFDQYLVHRPEMILRWEKNPGTEWQGLLWQEIVKRAGTEHLARRAHRFVEDRASGSLRAAGLPARLSVFGVSTLPPLFLDLLANAGELTEVHLFFLSPTEQFWGDIRSRREQARQKKRSVPAEEGHPLLASLGKVGREFHELLEEHSYEEDSQYIEASESSALGVLQNDILHLRTRGPGGSIPPAPHLFGDGSIEIHSCHSPGREVEVLHDRLLDVFASQEISPHDIVVLAPDIETYAPLIDAVFAGSGDSRPAIPYRIADRALGSSNQALQAFVAALKVVRGRFTSVEVLDLLGFQPVRTRFGLAHDDVEPIRAWVKDSGIRWGVDERHRLASGQPADRTHTWEFGRDRLLIGYAVPSDGDRSFRGVAPFDDIEGTGAEALGRFLDLCDLLSNSRSAFAEARPLVEWKTILSEFLASLVEESDDTSPSMQQLREALNELADTATRAGFSASVALSEVESLLIERIERRAPGRNFLSGGVTVCALVPMRSIPFRIVCLLGMSDGSFPRSQRPPSFDLISHKPRPGDRSQRDDDRYLFLEALLSARDKLIVTYVGQSVRDNGARPPSVVVGELIDCLNSSFASPALKPGEQIELFTTTPTVVSQPRPWVVNHPLQPFDARYFRDQPEACFVSYSEMYLAAARALAGDRCAAPRFADRPLPPSQAPVADRIPLDRLLRFFREPQAEFLRHRFGLRLDEREENLPSREPIELNNLERWKIGDALLRSEVLVENDLRAQAMLPPGEIGRAVEIQISKQAEALRRAALAQATGARLPPEDFEVAIGDSVIFGIIDSLQPGVRLKTTFSKPSLRSQLAVWITHLCWLASGKAPAGARSILIAREGGDVSCTLFRSEVDPMPILADLVDLYRRGLDTGLAFLPYASASWVESLEKPPDDIRKRVLTAFTNDAEKDSVKFLFSDPTELLGEGRFATEFREAAERVYGAMVAQMDEIDG